jgi:hypothetical protein
MTIVFKRKASEYLRLTAQITATASTFNTINGKISSTSNQMAASSTYSFTLITTQQLSNTPKITLQFHSDYTILSPTCTVSILGTSTSSISCS